MRISEHNSLLLKWFTLVVAAIALLLVMPSNDKHAHAIDPPHNGRNSIDMTISCSTCHYDTTGPTPSWATQPTTTDETYFNNLCTSCHAPSKMPDANYVVKTHSSSNSSGKYPGGWTVECRTCHNAHYQDQVNSYPTDATANLATGTISECAQTPAASAEMTVTVTAGGGLSPGAWIDHILIPNVVYPTKMYHIRGNTSNTITVSGAINCRYASAGSTFAIRTGTMVASQIKTPSGALATVKFFTKDPSQVNSYAATSDPANVTGICQVCHTRTSSFNRTNVTGSILEGPGHPAIQTGKACTVCHWHTSGFKPECGSCHGNPPLVNTPGGPNGLAVNEGGTGASTTGAHGRHAVSLGYACSACHSGGMPASAIYDKLIQIGFNIANGVYQGGIYDGRTTPANGYAYSAGNPGTAVMNGGSKVCSNVYCHGSAMAPNGGTDITPAWDDPSTAACGTCHGATASNPPTRGSHYKHARTDLVGYGYSCATCHRDPVSDTSLHVNGGSEVAFSGASASGGSYSGTTALLDVYGPCTNVYCHSTVQSSPPGGSPVYRVTPDWGGEIGNCGSCHDYAADLATGSHGKHMRQPVLQECWGCHNYTGIDDGCMACHDPDSIRPKRDRHANYSVDVALAPRYGGSYSGTPVPGDAYGFCANTYCHTGGTAVSTGTISANTSPHWGGGALPCDSCHGYGPSYPDGSPKANSHQPHSAKYACNICHAETTNNGSGISNWSAHANKAYDVNAGGFASFTYAFAPSGGSCQSNYCHSNAQPDGGVGAPDVTAPATWGGSYTVCGSCHKRDPGHNNVWGGPNVMSSGSHSAHAFSPDSLRCTYCHNYDPGNDNCRARCHDAGGDPKHVNGVIEVAFRTTNGFSGSYSGTPAPGNGYGQCSSTYCHGDSATPVWGAAGPLVCNACHGANNALAGAHGRHYESSVTATDRQAVNGSSAAAYRINCGICHYNRLHINGPAGVMMGGKPGQTAEVLLHYDVSSNNGTFSFEGTYAGGTAAAPDLNNPDRTFGWTNGACSNTYCHSSGAYITNPVMFPIEGTTPRWDGTGPDPQGDAYVCNNCHWWNIRHDLHSYHINDQNITCDACHSGTVDQCDNIARTCAIKDKSLHVNGRFDVSGYFLYTFSSYTAMVSSGQPTVYRGGSCDGVACHAVQNTSLWTYQHFASSMSVTSQTPAGGACTVGVWVANTSSFGDSSPYTYSFDWGDGIRTSFVSGDAASLANHTYQTWGSYTISWTARDARNRPMAPPYPGTLQVNACQ